MNNVFLHCHTSSHQCTPIIVGLSNTLSTNIASKNLPFFIKTPLIPVHFNLRHLFSRNSMPYPLTDLTEFSYSLTAFYENILRKSCSGGSPAAKPLPSKFVTKIASLPVLSHDASTNSSDPPTNASPASPALPPAPAVDAASGSPQNSSRRRPPPKRAGDVTKQAAGPATVD
jgi:hypothetical protein